jgi:hypothetical protein
MKHENYISPNKYNLHSRHNEQVKDPEVIADAFGTFL